MCVTEYVSVTSVGEAFRSVNRLQRCSTADLQRIGSWGACIAVRGERSARAAITDTGSLFLCMGTRQLYPGRIALSDRDMRSRDKHAKSLKDCDFLNENGRDLAVPADFSRRSLSPLTWTSSCRTQHHSTFPLAAAPLPPKDDSPEGISGMKKKPDRRAPSATNPSSCTSEYLFATMIWRSLRYDMSCTVSNLSSIRAQEGLDLPAVAQGN